ncbi:MAG: type II toxin-antitoxin system VapC family toxin, partial [Chloroflexota bacterium]
YKAALPSDKLRLCVKSLFDLELQTVAVNRELIDDSASISRRSGISVYDACYCAAARRSNMPLVTANPRHQGRSAACQIISLDEWGRQGPDLRANSRDAWR